MKNIKSILGIIISITLFLPAFAQEEKNVNQVLITNVTVWDGEGKDVIKADVLIVDNLVQEVKEGISVPEGATVIDGKGGTVTPGLIDMHTHIMHMPCCEAHA